VLAVVVFASSVPLFRFVNVNFTTQDDQSGFDLNVRAPEGTSLDGTEVIANRIGAAVRRIPEVEYTLVTVAGDGAGTQNSASMFVKLVPIEARSRDQFDVMAQVRTDVLSRSSIADFARPSAVVDLVAAASSTCCRVPSSRDCSAMEMPCWTR
jgi:HAE1 family hydrophobic/amphiphilic exporter-1